MGGLDKGLQLLHGRPLAAWVAERLQPQVAEVLINANRHPDLYARLGHAVIGDLVQGNAGPLAGLQSALAHARHDLVVTVPCDAPFLPVDLVRRLAGALRENAADLAVARGAGRNQPVFAMLNKSRLPSLEAFLAAGGRRVDAWHDTQRTVVVDFEDAGAFHNVNTLEDLRDLERTAMPKG